MAALGTAEAGGGTLGPHRSLPRSRAYALWGAALSAGAPLGLLVVRAIGAGSLGPGWIATEVGEDAATYAYVLLSTATVFAGFGHLLGLRADRLSELTRTDPLTGLPNLRAFRERLDEELARASRHGHPVSLLLVDVDFLKRINDEAGHGAGDDALRRVAEAVRWGSRLHDLPVRLGGDEFAVLAPETAQPDAVPLAERIRSLVTLPAGPPGMCLTISIGIATASPREGPLSPEDLLAEADAALYQAKRDGRDRVVLAQGTRARGKNA